MNDLLNTELFSLLAKSSQGVMNEEMKNAYENFVEQIVTLNQSETDYSIIFRALRMTRIEFISLQSGNLFEQGEKCAKNCIHS